MNNVNGVIVGIDIQDKITQAAIWDEQTEMVIHVTRDLKTRPLF